MNYINRVTCMRLLLKRDLIGLGDKVKLQKALIKTVELIQYSFFAINTLMQF